MFKKYITKLVAILVVLCLASQIAAPVSKAFANEKNVIRGYNPFIEYLIDKNDGRFIIRTVEGVPHKDTDDESKLLFERENDPETSFTTFKIGNSEYIFGNTYAMKSGRASVTSSDGKKTVSNWKIDGLDIKQTLEIIEDPEHPNVGNVRIRYDVINNSGSDKKVGSRIMLDTQLGSNDGSCFYLGNDLIKTETEIKGAALPEFYRTSDDEFAPNIIGYGFLKGWGNVAPDKVVFAHYETLSTNKWDVDKKLDGDLDFTSIYNKYEGADSAVAYYFNQKTLVNGASTTFETFYGIGDFSHYDSDSPYRVSVHVPEKLTLNAAKTGYVEKEMPVTVTIDNTMPNAENLTNVEVSIGKRDFAFANIDGQATSITIPLIEKGQITEYTFKLAPLAQAKYLSEPIKAVVTSDNQAEQILAYDYTLMPSISGELPKLAINAVSPATIYYEGYRDFSITGKGFNMLNNKGLWELYLVSLASGTAKKLEIPDDNVKIDSDEQLSITIYEDTFKEVTPPGEYVFELAHSDLGTIKTPESKAITLTKDPRYISRKYGVLYIEKIETDGKYSYEIDTVDSVEQLTELKKSKDIIIDIVGDVLESADANNNSVYKIKTDSQAATINSVIEYEKKGGDPIEIKKTGDIITIAGDGKLKIVGGKTFWLWKFYTYLEDGENYVVDEIITEEEEEENKAAFEIHPEWKPEEEEEKKEEKTNITIDFFSVTNTVGAAINSFYDGFNISINSVILLDEGASFGGSMLVRIPFGKGVPVEPEELSDKENEKLMYEALQDIFLSDEEKAEKYKKVETSDARKKAIKKVTTILLCNDGIAAKIQELIESSAATPPQKAAIVWDILLKSPELIMSIKAAIKGTPDDDPDRKSVGVQIDVKKVLFGKKYKDDFFYDSVRYIGLDGSGELKVTLPFGTKKDREENQGVRAYASINTIDGEYSFQTDVDFEKFEAHAIVNLVKVDNDLKADHVELSGGFDPGIPLVQPLYLNKLGGGVKNLQKRTEKEPLTIIVIMGLAVQPVFEGEFRGEFTGNGFSIVGSFEFKNGAEIFKEAYAVVQYIPPHFACGAKVELFDIINGSANLFIGAIPKEGGGHKFYFEGCVTASISIPEKVWLVGGKTLASAELGASLEKVWGNVEVIGIGVGVTYVYGKSVSFTDAEEDFLIENLTNVGVPETAMYKGHVTGQEGQESEGVLVIGSNIRKLGDSDSAYVSGGYTELYVVANAGNTSYDFIIDGQDKALFEIGFTGDTPNLTLIDPNEKTIPLVEDENYMVRVISPENSPSGFEEKYIYISVVDPIVGTYRVESDRELEIGTMYEAKSMPELKTLGFSRRGDKLDVSFTASNTEDAIVSLFLVNRAESENMEYAIASNLPADNGNVTVELPKNLPEGEYYLRASIQHPSYGYQNMNTEKTLTIVDAHKPAAISGLKVENIGNGKLSASWNELAEQGDITYYANVYDASGNKIAGYQNLQSVEGRLEFGGDYTTADAQGNEINYYSMEYGQSYVLGVTATKILTQEDGSKTIHIGNEVRSQVFTKRRPTPPELLISFSQVPFVSGGSNYFNSAKLSIDFASNQMVDTDVYLDGEYYMSLSNKNRESIPFELEDGMHSVEFRAVNAYKDGSQAVVDFVVDTAAPELRVDSPSTSVVAVGQVDVIGSCESSAELYLNDSWVEVNSDTSFNTSYRVNPNKMKELIILRAVDAAGNETIYTSEVINGSVDPVENIQIKASKAKVYSGTSEKLAIVAKYNDTGKEVEIDNKDLEFSILRGESLGAVSNDGEVTFYDSGKITIMASYALTDDYTVNDAIDITVESGIEILAITPEVNELTVNQRIELKAKALYKYGEEDLDNSKVHYSIVEGGDRVILTGNVLTAKKPGRIKIRAYYENGEISKEGFMEVNIARPQYYDDSDSDGIGSGVGAGGGVGGIGDNADYVEAEEIKRINSILTGVWKNLVEREKGLEITSVREIRSALNTLITLYNTGSLRIPKGTVANDDVLLTGIIRNPDSLIDNNRYRLDGDVYEFTFKNAAGKLNGEMTLRLRYDASEAKKENNLGIYVYNEIFGKWQYIGGVIEDGELVAGLEHLSKYAVLENIGQPSFVDINGSWAKDFINSMGSLDIVEGTNSGGYRYFSPNSNLTRLELAAFAVRVYEKLYPNRALKNPKAEDVFADYRDIQDWGKEYALKAFKYGIIEGSVDKNGVRRFNPKGQASRAETFTILSRAVGAESSDERSFKDGREIPAYARPHINNLVKIGLVDGYGDNTIKPNNKITRAEFAKLMYYWIDYEVLQRK